MLQQMRVPHDRRNDFGSLLPRGPEISHEAEIRSQNRKKDHLEISLTAISLHQDPKGASFGKLAPLIVLVEAGES
jgi:hypothetical protein